MLKKETEQGRFVQDQSGLWHYQCQKGRHVSDATEDALQNRPEGPVWFWFNGTLAPIFPSDSPENLMDRWHEWRDAFQRNPRELRDKLEELVPGRFEEVNT